ncbi:nigwaprin-b-like [Nilaparvata lugens]|uniref:nigwaprin-b-like n=1 Tax=Nilaparvata lugens TaxID=108931 RepID=UPI000B99AEB8|nr:nigwaprin-b-like [Nilaparvata lugens]
MVSASSHVVLLGAVALFAVFSSTLAQNARNCPIRTGLCPYVKRLVPDLKSHPVMEHYQPHIHGEEPPSLCGNLCTHDRQCPSDLKCCPTNCGYACFPPVHVVETKLPSPETNSQHHG